MTTKRVKKMGKEEMKEMFDLVIYAFNQEPTAERQERFEKLLSHTQSYGFLIDEQLTSQVMATPFQVNFHVSAIPWLELAMWLLIQNIVVKAASLLL